MPRMRKRSMIIGIIVIMCITVFAVFFRANNHGQAELELMPGV